MNAATQWVETLTIDGVTVSDPFGNTERRPATYRKAASLARFAGFQVGDNFPVTECGVTRHYVVFVTLTHGHRWVVPASDVLVYGRPVSAVTA